MRPRTKIQQRVSELSKKLPEISENQKMWAQRHCFKPVGYKSKDEVWCTCCGKTFIDTTGTPIGMSLGLDKAYCPYCGELLELKGSRKQHLDEKSYFTVIATSKEFQICRNVEIVRYGKKGKYFGYSAKEIVQNWIDPDGKETIVARTIGGFSNHWVWSSPLEIRIRRTRYWGYDGKYEIDTDFVYPERRIIPKVRKYGFSGRFRGLPMSEYIKLLLTSNKAEEYSKTGQFWLLELYAKRGGIHRKWHHAVNICNRQGYKIKDGSMWLDYLNLLEYFGLDTHNAKYVCPKNLKAEHDKLEKRKRERQAKLEAERKREEAVKWEAEYSKVKGKYFGICFGNEDIMVTVIQSVADIAEEGKAMHHCVYTNGYYKRADALILSAKDKEGNRLETIEVNLRSFKIVQSRGICNQNSPKHDDIVALVNKNMNLIRAVS